MRPPSGERICSHRYGFLLRGQIEHRPVALAGQERLKAGHDPRPFRRLLGDLVFDQRAQEDEPAGALPAVLPGEPRLCPPNPPRQVRPLRQGRLSQAFSMLLEVGFQRGLLLEQRIEFVLRGASWHTPVWHSWMCSPEHRSKKARPNGRVPS